MPAPAFPRTPLLVRFAQVMLLGRAALLVGGALFTAGLDREVDARLQTAGRLPGARQLVEAATPLAVPAALIVALALLLALCDGFSVLGLGALRRWGLRLGLGLSLVWVAVTLASAGAGDTRLQIIALMSGAAACALLAPSNVTAINRATAARALAAKGAVFGGYAFDAPQAQRHINDAEPELVRTSGPVPIPQQDVSYLQAEQAEAVPEAAVWTYDQAGVEVPAGAAATGPGGEPAPAAAVPTFVAEAEPEVETETPPSPKGWSFDET
jgi:hypothetical protein